MDDSVVAAALANELAAAQQVIDWAKAQPKSWHRKKFFLAGVLLIVPFIIHGKMNAVSGYYITTQLWHPITQLWHLVPSDLQHAFRGVMEGVYGGIVLQYHSLNAFKAHILAKWEKYEARLTVGSVIWDLFKVFLWGTLGFAVGYGFLWANQHNIEVHKALLFIAPANLLHIHLNLAQLLTPKTWNRLAAVFVSDAPLMLVGFIATHLGRPNMRPALWEIQGYRAARAVLRRKPDRWFHSRGYCMRKQLFRILGNDSAQQEVNEASRTIRIAIPVAMWASVPAALAGLYIMLVIAQHAVVHIGHITLS